MPGVLSRGRVTPHKKVRATKIATPDALGSSGNLQDFYINRWVVLPGVLSRGGGGMIVRLEDGDWWVVSLLFLKMEYNPHPRPSP